MSEPEHKKFAGLQFDRTISLGHILTTVTIIGGLIVAYASYRESHRDHESRLLILERQYNNIVDQMKTMWEIKENVAVIKDRIERVNPPTFQSR